MEWGATQSPCLSKMRYWLEVRIETVCVLLSLNPTESEIQGAGTPAGGAGDRVASPGAALPRAGGSQEKADGTKPGTCAELPGEGCAGLRFTKEMVRF